MNILLSSAGRRTYLVKYFKDALNGNGLIHASNSEYSPALQEANKYVITPLIYDSGYIDVLIEYCKKNNITAIISLFDIDLPILSKNKGLFDKYGIKVVVSDYEVIQICNDKWKTYNFCLENKINTPKTYLSVYDASIAIKNNEISFPVIVKPRWGMGSIGIYSADDFNELKIFYKKIKKEIFNSYLSFESESDYKKCVIIQEKIEGQEYGLDVVNDLNGKYVTTFVKQKIAMRSGETDSAITVNEPQLEKLGNYISNNLKHVGNLDVDCFVCGSKEYVLEMNCRFGGGYPFSHLSGANLPLAIIKWLKGEKADKNLFEVEYGIKVVKDINPIIL